MSLDLYIKSKIPVKKVGTGIYVRENGKNRELETSKEVQKYFPGTNIQERIYETTEVWHTNLTHNLRKMADLVNPGERSLYRLLWHPDSIVNVTWANDLFRCYQELRRNKDSLKPLENENKSGGEIWGTYEDLHDTLRSLIEFLLEIDYYNNEYLIVACV